MANPSLQVPYPGLPYMGQPGDALRDPPTAPIDPTLANAPVVDPTQTGLAYRDTPAPEVLTNPYAQGGAAGSFSRGIHKGIEDTVVGAKNIYGLAQVGLGYRDAAAQTFQEAKAQADKATAEGPQTSTFEQARQSGDYGGYVAGLAGEALPSLATMLIPGGVGGKIGTKIAEKGAARIAEKIGAQASERALAQGATEDAAAQAATTASTTAARRLAGTDGAKAVADVANRAGEVAGTTVGGLPGAAASNTDQLANASPDDLGDVAGKVALGTLASSAVGALPAARLLDRAGQTAVEETTKSLIPRVAKEMGVQAAVAGGAGVAQTAATLATHKWVGDNVDLLSPASFDQYLDSLIGGGVIGGVTGGLLGAMKGAHAPDIDVRKTFRDNFDRFSNRGKPVDAEEGTPSQGGADGVSVDEAPTDVPNSVKAFMDAHAELKSQSAEAAAVFNTSFKHSDDGQQSVIDALHKSYDKAETKTAKQAIMKMMGKYAEDVTPEPSGDAGFQARHDDALEGMQRDEKIDSIVNDAHASHEAFMQGADPIAGDAPRATNPVQMATPMQNMLAAYVPRDHPIWQAAPDALKSIVKSAAKMLSTSEDLTPKDTRNIDLMRQLVGDSTVDKWKIAGPMFAKAYDVASRMAKDVDHAAPDTEASGPRGSVETTRRDIQTKSLADMPRTEIADRFASVDPSTPEHAELRAAFREQLKPDIVLENKKGNGPSFFASKEALPSTVEMAAQKTPYGPRRRLVDVNNMIGHELQKNPGSSATVVGKVLGDLKLAGVKIKPESIKAGTWYKSADGSSEVRVSPRQAAQLRGDTPRLTDAQAKRAREQTQADIKKRNAPKKEENADQNLLEKSERENASTSSDTKPSFDEEAGSGHAADKFAQGPRIDPPSGDVADVRASTPHAKTLKAATKELNAVTKGVEKAKAEGTLTPRLRGELAQKFAQVRHEAGVKIGRAELEKSEVNDRTLAKKLKQLEDPKSGLSKKYFDDAKAGKFDSASVTETKPDTVKRAGQDPKDSVGAKENVKAADKADKLTARADDNIAQGFRDVTGSGKNDHAKETELANALLKRLNFIGPKVKILPGALSKVEVTGGRWQSDGNIYIADHLHGPERMEVIAHELGHHVVHHELGDALENAKPELRAALQADYDRWATENHGHDRTVADVLASRKPFFRGERIRDNATDKKATALPLDKYNYLYDMHEYLADQFARALTQKKESQTIIGKFFSGIAAKLRAVYDGMFGAERAEYAPAESVDKWVQSLFDRNRDNVREATGQSVPKETAEHFVRAAHATMHAEDVTQGDALEANQHYVDYMLTPETRGILSRALDRRLVERQIRAAFGDDTALMKRMEGATGLATRFYLANKLFGEGKLDLGAKNPVLEPFLTLRNGLFRLAGLAGNNDKALQLFTDTRNGAIERAGQHGYSVDKAVEATRKTDNARKIQETLNTANRIYRAQGFNPFRLVMYGPGSNIHYSYTTALAKIGGLLKLHTGEAGEDGGYLPMRVTKKQEFYKQMDATLGALSKTDLAAVREHLQTRAQMSDIPSAAQRKAVAAMRDLYRSGFDYGRKAGLKLGDKGKDYFGVSMDKADVVKRESEFKALLSNPKFEKGFREASGFKGPRNELIDSLYKHAAGLHELSDTAVDPLAPPDFKPLNQRLMQAIYDHGTPEEVKQFAGFQSKDLAEIAHNYFGGLVDKAEYTRRFGENGEKLAAIFDDAKKQGASDADIAHVRDYVAAATGAYAKDGSPIIRKLFRGDNDVTYNKAIEAAKARGASKAELDGIQRKFGDKAGDFFGSDKYKQGSGMLMAYQNIRTLPLSVLSAIADPMGIGVRYGGFRSVKDVTQSWKSFRDGFKLLGGKGAQAVRDQADIIALAGDHVVSDMMANGYAPGAEGFARKASDMFFKANGLNWFVKSTRYMALSAANAFLLKHAASLDPKHSPRYLRELGVKEGDIRTGDKGLVKLLTDDERQHATDAQLASDDRVRNALNRFVNESILRVDPSQHPIYFNDPAFRLVTQYQQFGHAFAETIIDRIVHEAHFSNFHVLAPAMGYIPVTAAAEMARSFIQYGPAGNPSQANWDPLDWVAFAGDRAGLLGPRVRQGLGLVEGKAYAGMGHMVEIGPTGQQLGDVLHTLEGDRSVSSTVVESLPAGSLLRHW